MTRQEHLDWAKRRALEYVDQGELQDAISSMMSDLGKHDELRDHPGIVLGLVELIFGLTPERTRYFIEGFN